MLDFLNAHNLIMLPGYTDEKVSRSVLAASRFQRTDLGT
jgi:hypothetical protein